MNSCIDRRIVTPQTACPSCHSDRLARFRKHLTNFKQKKSYQLDASKDESVT